MKTSIFAYLSVFFFLISSVVSAPTATKDIQARADFEDVDVIIKQLIVEVKEVDAVYNTTSSKGVSNYCNDIGDKFDIAIEKIGKIPSGHKFLDVDLIVELLCELLIEINYTLKELLGKHGLLGSLLFLVLSLVGGLVAIIGKLLFLVSGIVDGVLILVAALLHELLGGSYLLKDLGLLI